MSEYQKKAEQTELAYSKYRESYAIKSKARQDSKEARIHIELEALLKLNLSYEELLVKCAKRTVEWQIDYEAAMDLNELTEIAFGALKNSAPMAETFSAKQSETASNSRSLLPSEEAISDLYATLARRKEYSGELMKANDLWFHLFSALDEAGSEPHEVKNPGKPMESYYSYTLKNGNTKQIKKSSFHSAISKIRNS